MSHSVETLRKMSSISEGPFRPGWPKGARSPLYSLCFQLLLVELEEEGEIFLSFFLLSVGSEKERRETERAADSASHTDRQTTEEEGGSARLE